MTCRIEVRGHVKEGRLAEAVDLGARVIARVTAMGGPVGLFLRDSVGGQIGSGIMFSWDFDDYAAWAAWEDGSATDQEWQAIFAEILEADSPFVLPFDRQAYTALL